MKTAEQNLSEMTLTGLNLITQAISIHDQDLRLVHANQRFQTMFQLPDRFVQPGAEFRDILIYVAEMGEYGPVDNVEEFVDEKVSLARNFEPHYFERTRANGTTITIEGNPIKGGGWISVYTDITETKRQEAFFQSHAEGLSAEILKQAEVLRKSNRQLSATIRTLEATKQELLESRERLELINRMTPAHIAHVDAGGTYTHSNGKLPSVLPEADEDIVGRQFQQVLGDEIWDHVGPRFKRVLDGDSSVSEFRDEVSGHFIRLAMSPDYDKSGEVVGAYILSTDVTEETLARHALAHARRKELATQLTSVMSHDFSNLLTIIMGQQNRLEASELDDAERADISQTIKTAARRGAELIKNLNQIETQRNVEPVNTNFQQFAEALEQLASAALPANVTLKFHAQIPDDSILLDPGFAQDAVLNLVINASEACEDAGEINVDIRQTGDHDLEFLVTDNGSGFSEDALANALSPFYSTKGAKIGRGLGLTSAFDFAKSCGGNLRIRNSKMGGAVVSIKIPYQAARPGQGELVLLVDDDDDVRETVRANLRRAGYSVIEASAVEEAEKLIAIDGLAYVVTDLDLGNNRTGLEVLSQVPNNIPKLVLTGLPLSDLRRKSAEQSYPVLTKPIGYEDLQAALAMGLK